MADGAAVVATRLAAAGCRFAFGIPGGEVLAIVEALHRAGIRVELSRHENAAGFMAEGAYHADGAPGVLIATVGPGVANAINVVANAYQDRVPLLFLTGRVSAFEAATLTHQVIDQQALLRPITKASLEARDGVVGHVIDQAVRLAMEGRPGPVHVDLATDVQEAEQGGAPAPITAPIAPAAPAPGAALDQARAWLARAERPLVIGGVDLLKGRGADAVARFCKRHGAPLITTYKAKGALDEADPLALGGAGLSPRADRHLLPLIARADFVLSAGYDPIEMRSGWRDPFPAGARVVEFAHAPQRHDMHRPALAFVCDVATGIEALDGVVAKGAWAAGEPWAAKAALSAEEAQDEDWGPAAAIACARAASPENAVATADSGAHRILLSQIWRCNEVGGLLQSSAFCTMGCALPLAIGRKLAEPARPVIAFIGDAGLEMTLGELATLRDLGLAVPIVVFVDRQLGLIEKKQRERQFPERAVAIGGSDFPAIGRALGGHGVVVRDRDAMTAAVRDAFAADRFTLIAAEIGERAYDGRL